MPIVTTDPIVLSTLFAELSLRQLPRGTWAAAISRTFALKVSGLPRCGCNCGCTLLLSLVTILSGCEINNFAGQSAKSVCYNLVAMFDLFRLWLGAVLRGFRT
ncbi:MAG TPA: hypothetical protein VFC29_21855, partial [Candidatus Limnocylindrales bacterium]|nr:hypothetical protein [Candidatus Limnocylindrales bacterium]